MIKTIGKVKYTGKSFEVEGLTNAKVYDVVSIDLPFIMITDDSREDYLYSISKPLVQKFLNYAVNGK